MSFVKELDNLRIYVETELQEKVIEAMELLVDKHIKELIKNVNDNLLYENGVIIYNYFVVDDLTIKCGGLKSTCDIIKNKPISYEKFIKKIVLSNIKRICDKYMLKYFDGLLIDNHYYNDFQINYTLQRFKNKNFKYERIISEP